MPDANISLALTYLHIIISKHRRAYPDGVHIIAGDFNQACLKTVLPKCSQYVKCATRGRNTLDRVYSNIKHGYRAVPLPDLGLSDHVSLFLVPAYTPLRKRMSPTTKTIKTWPEGALSQLQDCFARTRWGLFKHQDVAEDTQTVLHYQLYWLCHWGEVCGFFQTRNHDKLVVGINQNKIVVSGSPKNKWMHVVIKYLDAVFDKFKMWY